MLLANLLLMRFHRSNGGYVYNLDSLCRQAITSITTRGLFSGKIFFKFVVFELLVSYFSFSSFIHQRTFNNLKSCFSDIYFYFRSYRWSFCQFKSLSFHPLCVCVMYVCVYVYVCVCMCVCVRTCVRVKIRQITAELIVFGV